ncbi:hypothetical protein [Candidatus Vampirococcus lugosii]|uniref:Uncharacterized protein n=1 Tax=Candidatus Vampirococcus lugosii TaxID=2789015 RepID=A0ABS5QML0_9BACT|nr:hypothetical protein [Candidatus Vampirococcus lugosii]MBS8122430.1 hypothetical protein [Candidatus Vampirococcus lugosii]
MENKKCEQYLANYIKSKNFNDKESISYIMKNAWGENISNCYKYFGGSADIKDFIKNLKSNQNYKYTEEKGKNNKKETIKQKEEEIQENIKQENIKQENIKQENIKQENIGQFDSMIDSSIYLFKIIGICFIGIIVVLLIKYIRIYFILKIKTK